MSLALFLSVRWARHRTAGRLSWHGSDSIWHFESYLPYYLGCPMTSVSDCRETEMAQLGLPMAFLCFKIPFPTLLTCYAECEPCLTEDRQCGRRLCDGIIPLIVYGCLKWLVGWRHARYTCNSVRWLGCTQRFMLRSAHSRLIMSAAVDRLSQACCVGAICVEDAGEALFSLEARRASKELRRS